MKIFFDVDGVLIDGWCAVPERRQAWDATIEQDLGIDREALQRALFSAPEGRTYSLMAACVTGKRDLKDVLATVLPTLGYHHSADTLISYWFEKDSNVNLKVLDIVKRLGKHRDVDLYLATGQEHRRASYLWNRLGFRFYFRDIYYSARLGIPKSCAEFFIKINTQLNISPSEHPLFFDDTAEAVRAAREAGWDAHVFDTAADLLGNQRLRQFLKASTSRTTTNSHFQRQT